MRFRLRFTNNPCCAFIGLICSVLLPSALYELFSKRPTLFVSILLILGIFIFINLEKSTAIVLCVSPNLLISKTGECVASCPIGMASDGLACMDCFNTC